MAKGIFHTPDGFSDRLPAECMAKRDIENRLRQLFAKACYREVQTPGFEFADVYGAGNELTGTESLFKTFDAHGRILAARFDGTVGVARLAATKLADAPLPLRLAYIDDMYRYVPEGGSRLRSFTQAGLELLGSASPAADGEVIAMAIQAAKTCGLDHIHVSVGEADFFKSMLEEWGLSGTAAEQLTRLLDSKSILNLEKFAESTGLSAAAIEVLQLMLEGEGIYDQLDRLKALVKNKQGHQALDRLRGILDYLADRDLLAFISVDLTMLQSINYYTGMVFKGYTYNLGAALFSGGRYDGVTAAFGKPMSATGFSINLDQALAAVRRQGGRQPAGASHDAVLFAAGFRKKAFVLAEQLRSGGRAVELGLDPVDSVAEARHLAAERGAEHLFYVADEPESIAL